MKKFIRGTVEDLLISSVRDPWNNWILAPETKLNSGRADTSDISKLLPCLRSLSCLRSIHLSWSLSSPRLLDPSAIRASKKSLFRLSHYNVNMLILPTCELISPSVVSTTGSTSQAHGSICAFIPRASDLLVRRNLIPFIYTLWILQQLNSRSPSSIREQFHLSNDWFFKFKFTITWNASTLISHA